MVIICAPAQSAACSSHKDFDDKVVIKIYKEQKLVQTFTWQCNHYGHFWIRFKTSPEASELQHTLDVQS